MLSVNQDNFLEWVNKRFDDAIVAGNEIKVQDIWWTNEDGNPDRDNKCWINIDKCCYRAFKSNRTGNIIEFVKEIDNCSWDEALNTLGLENNISNLEEKLIAFFQEEQKKDNNYYVKQVVLPHSTHLIKDAPECNIKNRAIDYLASRKLDNSKLMVCLGEGKYKGRIIIPYYDKSGKLIYFNSRTLDKNNKLRYYGPAKEEFGVGKGDVLWMSSFPEKGSRIYLTEGEFDAMSLSQCGLRSGACGGKSFNFKQNEMVKDYCLCLAFDADKAGKDFEQIGKFILENGKARVDSKSKLTMVRPPENLKDWNQFYIEHGANIVLKYIEKYEKEFDLEKMKIESL